MTAKDQELISDPWEIWPDGIIPGEGNRPEWRLRSAEQGKAWLRELAELRKTCRLPDDTATLDIVRRERDEH